MRCKNDGCIEGGKGRFRVNNKILIVLNHLFLSRNFINEILIDQNN